MIAQPRPLGLQAGSPLFRCTSRGTGVVVCSVTAARPMSYLASVAWGARCAWLASAKVKVFSRTRSAAARPAAVAHLAKPQRLLVLDDRQHAEGHGRVAGGAHRVPAGQRARDGRVDRDEQRVPERLALDTPSRLRLRHDGAAPELVRGTELLAIVPQRFADAVAARHDLRLGRLPDGASCDVMMVRHHGVNGDPAERWPREQVRRLFVQDRVAASEPGAAAARAAGLD